MVHERKQAKLLKELTDEFDANPIVKKLDDEPIEYVTTQEDIKGLQQVLVQAAIDYIKEHSLSDIDAINFHVDGLSDSIKEGKWMSGTDSSIQVDGIHDLKYERKNGDVIKMPERYVIGTYC